MIGNKQGKASEMAAFITILEPLAQTDEHGDPLPAPQPFAAEIASHNGRIIELYSPCAIAIDCALKIEASDAIWLGSVESCAAMETELDESSNEFAWHVSVQVTRVLRDMDTLRRLAELFGSPGITNPNLFRNMTVRV